MDKLKQAACCHIYSARDYALEGSGSEDGSGGAAQFMRKVDPLLSPPSPSAMARWVRLGVQGDLKTCMSAKHVAGPANRPHCIAVH